MVLSFTKQASFIRVLVVLAVGFFLAFSLSFARAQANDDELRVRWWQDIVSLDPPQLRDSLATEVAYKIYSNLVRVKPGTFDEIVPDLAESWEVSPDGLVYTFHLRDDAQWHRDYGEVTAEDVRYSLLRHKDEEVGSNYQPEAEPIEDVEVVDDHTVRIVLNKPYPGLLLEFLAYRPGFIVNERAITELGDQYTEQPIGSGPFVFESWSPNERVELVRNDEYYGETGPFERVTYVIIPEDTVFEVALDRGDVDIGYFLDAEVQSRAIDNPNFETVVIPAPRTFYLNLNTEKAPFDDVRVRQALWYALDKDLIVDAVLEGQGEATDTVLNPYVFGRLDERPYTYDPEKAQELLAEAGYPDGFEATLLIYPPYGIPDMAAAMQDMWRDIGVDVEIIQREWAQHVELRRSGNFDIGLQPMLRLGPDQYITPLIHSASSPYPNASRYSNPEMDMLVEQAREEVDDEQRRELYHEIQRRAHEEVPVIPLLNPVFVLAFQPYIDNAKPGLLTINVTELEVDR